MTKHRFSNNEDKLPIQGSKDFRPSSPYVISYVISKISTDMLRLGTAAVAQ